MTVKSELNYIERVDHYRNDVRSELQTCYETLLGQGCAPHIAAATLQYISGLHADDDTHQTQEAVCDAYGLASMTLRRWRDIILDEAYAAFADAGVSFDRDATGTTTQKSHRSDLTDADSDSDYDSTDGSWVDVCQISATTVPRIEPPKIHDDRRTNTTDDGITLSGAFIDIVVINDETGTETLLAQTADDLTLPPENVAAFSFDAIIHREAFAALFDGQIRQTSFDSVAFVVFDSPEATTSAIVYSCEDVCLRVSPPMSGSAMDVGICRVEGCRNGEHGFTRTVGVSPTETRATPDL